MTDQAVAVTRLPELVLPDQDFVRYVGVASTRIIHTGDWPGTVSGAPKQDLVWDAGNRWNIQKKGLSADVLRVLADDGNFVVSEK